MVPPLTDREDRWRFRRGGCEFYGWKGGKAPRFLLLLAMSLRVQASHKHHLTFLTCSLQVVHIGPSSENFTGEQNVEYREKKKRRIIIKMKMKRRRRKRKRKGEKKRRRKVKE